MLNNIYPKSKWSVFLNSMLWLNKNKFCNYAQRKCPNSINTSVAFWNENLQKHLKTLQNKQKFHPSLSLKQRKTGIWKLSSKRPGSESINPDSCLHAYYSQCVGLSFLIYSLQQSGTVSREPEGKKKSMPKLPGRVKNKMFNPKGQLLSHTWHSLRYFCCSEVHSWAGTMPPQPHRLIPWKCKQTMPILAC